MTTIHISLEDMISFDYLYTNLHNTEKLHKMLYKETHKGTKNAKKIRSMTMYTYLPQHTIGL